MLYIFFFFNIHSYAVCNIRSQWADNKKEKKIIIYFLLVGPTGNLSYILIVFKCEVVLGNQNVEIAQSVYYVLTGRRRCLRYKKRGPSFFQNKSGNPSVWMTFTAGSLPSQLKNNRFACAG